MAVAYILQLPLSKQAFQNCHEEIFNFEEPKEIKLVWIFQNSLVEKCVYICEPVGFSRLLTADKALVSSCSTRLLYSGNKIISKCVAVSKLDT